MPRGCVLERTTKLRQMAADHELHGGRQHGTKHEPGAYVPDEPRLHRLVTQIAGWTQGELEDARPETEVLDVLADPA